MAPAADYYHFVVWYPHRSFDRFFRRAFYVCIILIMCGIFGIITNKKSGVTTDTLRKSVDVLFQLSESRGKEASGLALLYNGEINVYKQPIKARELVETNEYKKIFQGLDFSDSAKHSTEVKKVKSRLLAVIGHTRLATHGYQNLHFNNQPVVRSDIVGVHNGIVTNDKHIWQEVLHQHPRYNVDTEVLLALMHFYRQKGFFLIESTQEIFRLIEGSASIALLFDDAAKLLLATNTSSLFMYKTASPESIIFTSEAYILRKFLQKNFFNIDSPNPSIAQIQAGTGCVVDLMDLSSTSFPLRKLPTPYPKAKKISKKIFTIKDLYHQESPSVSISNHRLNSLQKIKQHDFDYTRIAAVQRCVRCILPVTMPFIRFDQNGLCHYCRNHEPIRYLGPDALERRIAPYRSANGEPDCIVAFSGGRDSSYGLYYMKKVLHMNPIAYTYDWGMITDLARRNEARLVGKLGVEHIIVSADISMKLRHIKQHILAWMKKPNLAMVPLFMEGDKQCEYYAYQLMKKTGIKLVIYCRGNELENEDFKHGHAGIRNPTPQGVIHNLSVPGKLQIAAYYGWQYLTNPSYINSSLFDTAFAYVSTFIMHYDFVYLWHYIPWDEKKIIGTLQHDYGWETDKQTKATWRTDDGTAAFYNYIYYQVQGFTEHDTFRSNQVREGILTRKAALSLVAEENKPRYEALQWYFDRIGLDGYTVLSVVDTMPKRY